MAKDQNRKRDSDSKASPMTPPKRGDTPNDSRRMSLDEQPQKTLKLSRKAVWTEARKQDEADDIEMPIAKDNKESQWEGYVDCNRSGGAF